MNNEYHLMLLKLKKNNKPLEGYIHHRDQTSAGLCAEF